jgi:hypothetical protein
MDDALRTQQTAADRVHAVGVDGVPDESCGGVEQPSTPGFILWPLWILVSQSRRYSGVASS